MRNIILFSLGYSNIKKVQQINFYKCFFFYKMSDQTFNNWLEEEEDNISDAEFIPVYNYVKCLLRS